FLLPLIVLPYLICVLGVEKFGLTAFAAALVNYFLNITQFGFSLSAVRDLSKNQDNPQRLEEIYNAVINTKFFLLILSAIVFALLIIIVPAFSEYYLLYIFSFGLVVGDVLFPKWFFQGVEQMRFITIINILFKLTFLILVFLFIKQESDFVYVPLLQSIGIILGGIFSLFIIYKKYGIRYRPVAFSEVKAQLKLSFSSFVTLIVPTLYSNTSVFLLGIFTNNTLVGYLSGALRISNAFSSFNAILTRTFYPFVNKTKNSISKVNNVILLSGLLVSILMIVTAKHTVSLILGLDMLKSIPLVMILSLTPLLLAIRTVYGINFLLVKKLDKLYMNIALFSSLFGFLLAFVFIPMFTYYGAAIVIVSAQLLYAVLSFIYAKKNK
ncbi:oligosaccharide flippase family protein, partial [Winogradskyella sp.]|uniref:oligosaccharide flippase family protein n=1 Tax=Winogradskyella sp. TaxID=1883156 RepID=UPI0025F8B1AB